MAIASAAIALWSGKVSIGGHTTNHDKPLSSLSVWVLNMGYPAPFKWGPMDVRHYPYHLA